MFLFPVLNRSLKTGIVSIPTLRTVEFCMTFCTRTICWWQTFPPGRWLITRFQTATAGLIDHVFLSDFAYGGLKCSQIMDHCHDNVSDHYPIKTRIELHVSTSCCTCGEDSGGYRKAPVYPRLDWSREDIKQQYFSL